MKIPLEIRIRLARGQIAYDARSLRSMRVPNEAIRRMIRSAKLQWRLWVGAVI